MKTKELIRQLQEVDPSGEEECSVGNQDIHFVVKEPAYYDGCLQVLQRDETRNDYNIIGAKVTSEGDKIVIHTLSIRSAIWNAAASNETFPIEYDEYSKRHYEEQHEEWYKEAADFEKELEEEDKRA